MTTPTRRPKTSKPALERSGTADPKVYAKWVYDKLQKLYPDACCALTHRNPYELLIATILSAQCTDVRVNMVTPALFKQYPNTQALATAPIGQIEQLIRSTGFFRQKAKSLKGASQQLVEHHDGHVPDTMEALTQLPGVARKTANVVLGNAYNKNVGVVVDTHVSRLSQRLGLSTNTSTNKIEQDLIALYPQAKWTMLSHLLIHHGRQVCSARKPKCQQCQLAKDCPKIGVAC